MVFLADAVAVDFGGDRTLEQRQRQDQAQVRFYFNNYSFQTRQGPSLDGNTLADLDEGPGAADEPRCNELLDGEDFPIRDGCGSFADSNN